MKKFRIREVLPLCRCVEDCECNSSYALEIDGGGGFGSAQWVLDPKTNKEFFACRFLGWDFSAETCEEMRQGLQERINLVCRDGSITVEMY